MSTEEFYLQDARGYVGNDLLFWGRGGEGYTTDLSKAEVYSREEALAKNRNRTTDIPWPKDYVDAHVRPTVDMQNVDISSALKGHNITLSKPEKWKKPRYRCGSGDGGCGTFMSEITFYGGPCDSCGCDNRP